MLEQLELKLLGGYPIETSVGNMFQAKVKDIVEIDESTYNKYLSLLLYDVDLIEEKSIIEKQFGIGEFTTFEFLIMQSISSEEFKDIAINALEFFLKQPVHLADKYGFFYIGDIENQKVITSETYSYIRKILIKMNYLKEMEEEEQLEFANETAREWYMNIKKLEREKPKIKPQVNLHSIISAMMWRTDKTVDEIFNMTVYQLYDGYYRLFLIDDCLGVKQGIYAGTVDSDKVKPDDLNWAKIIQNEEN